MKGSNIEKAAADGFQPAKSTLDQNHRPGPLSAKPGCDAAKFLKDEGSQRSHAQAARPRHGLLAVDRPARLTADGALPATETSQLVITPLH